MPWLYRHERRGAPVWAGASRLTHKAPSTGSPPHKMQYVCFLKPLGLDIRRSEGDNPQMLQEKGALEKSESKHSPFKRRAWERPECHLVNENDRNEANFIPFSSIVGVLSLRDLCNTPPLKDRSRAEIPANAWQAAVTSSCAGDVCLESRSSCRLKA